MSARWYVPAYEVQLNDAPLPRAVARHVTDVTVVNEPDTFDHLRLTLANPYPELPFTHGELAAVFVAGGAVSVSLGYVGRLSPLFAGEITSISPAFPETGRSTVVVEAYTRLHLLRGSPKTRTFVRMNDAQIARKVLDEMQAPRGLRKLRLDADPTPDVHEYVIQYNQTDLAFLLERAGRLGFSVWVEDTTLHFKQRDTEPAEQYTLVWGHPADGFLPGTRVPLRSFTPTLNTMQQVSAVTVQGYDQKQGKVVRGTAPEGLGAPAAGSGSVVAEEAGRRVETVIVDRPIESEAEARRIAQAIYDRRTLEFVSGTGSSIGLPELRAGRQVELDGLGPIFNGTYLVTQSTHALSGAGYLTSFNAKKGTIG